MDHADRRLGRVLPDRVRAVPRLLRGRRPASRGLDRLEIRYCDDAGRIEPIEFPEAQLYRRARQQSRIRADGDPASLRAWSARRALTTYDVADARAGPAQGAGNPLGLRPLRSTRTERLEIAARDGTPIPVSVMYRKDRDRTQGRSTSTATAPTASRSRRASRPRASAWSTAASPMPSRTSAAATISARAWYKAGKLERRTNTFTRLRRRRERADRARPDRAGQDRDLGRLGGRRADGRGGQFRSRAVGRGGRARAVRRRARRPCSTPRCR